MQEAESRTDEALGQLSELLKVANYVNGRMSALIGRPANTGTIGEFIASAVFGIALSAHGVTKAIDGHFGPGLLEGQSVNVKFYARRATLLDLAASRDPNEHAEWYLVLAGPPAPYATKGTTAPLVIEHVFCSTQGLCLINSSQIGSLIRFQVVPPVSKKRCGPRQRFIPIRQISHL